VTTVGRTTEKWAELNALSADATAIAPLRSRDRARLIRCALVLRTSAWGEIHLL